MSLDCERKPENPEGTHADIWRTEKLHTEGLPRPGIKPIYIFVSQKKVEKN